MRGTQRTLPFLDDLPCNRSSGKSGTTGRGFAARHAATGLIVGAAAIAVVTGLIAVLKQFVEPLGLISLYLFAIFPVSIGWGFWVAGIVAVTSYLAFAFFFAAPLHSLRIADSDTAAALVVSLVTAYVVSELARRAHARAREARLFAQEADDAQTELVASRARLVTAGDDARRRIVRDLHDGAQQRLVHTIVTLRLAQRTREDGDVEAAKDLLAEALENAERANTELRELAHGILPTALTRGGLAHAVAALVSRARIPVGVDVLDRRTSSSPKRSRTSPSTPVRTRRRSGRGPRTASCGWTSATTAPAALVPTAVACSGCTTASYRSAATFGSRAHGAAAPGSRPPCRCNADAALTNLPACRPVGVPARGRVSAAGRPSGSHLRRRPPG